MKFSACDIFASAVGGLLDISENEATMIKNASRTINQLLKRKADEFGWHFISLAEDFAGHGYCEGGNNALWVRAEDSCNNQGDFDGTMHPTFRGHMLAARRYHDALVTHTMGG